MFKNILVSVGEADQGRQAALLAKRLGEPGAKVTLTRIHGAYAIVGRGGADARRNAEKRLADVALRRARLATGISDTVAYGAPSVGQGLGKLASELRADLIIVGSSFASTPGQLALDPALTRGLAASAPCVVAVAPAQPAANTSGPIRRIGIAYDDTPDSVRALAMARRYATRLKAGLYVFEAEGAHRNSNSYGDASGFRPLDELRELSSQLDLLIAPGRLSARRGRLRNTTVEELAGSSFAPMLIVTRNTVAPQVVGGAAPAEYWAVGARA